MTGINLRKNVLIKVQVLYINYLNLLLLDFLVRLIMMLIKKLQDIKKESY